MVQDSITNAILIIAAVIATAVVLTAVYPAVFNAADAVRSATAGADSRASTSIVISACNFSGDYSRLDVWMKNTGDEKIADPDGFMVYYGDGPDALKRYRVADASVYSPDGTGSDWEPGMTATIGIVDSSPGIALPHGPGVHVLKVVLPTGAESQYTFTI